MALRRLVPEQGSRALHRRARRDAAHGHRHLRDARATNMAQLAAGYSRRGGEARFYLGEFAMNAVASDLADDPRAHRLNSGTVGIGAGIDTCRASKDLNTLLQTGAPRFCDVKDSAAVQSIANLANTSLATDPEGFFGAMMRPDAPSDQAISADFRVEMTDHAPAPSPVAGMPVSRTARKCLARRLHRHGPRLNRSWPTSAAMTRRERLREPKLAQVRRVHDRQLIEPGATMRKLTRINWVLLAGLTCLTTDAVARSSTPCRRSRTFSSSSTTLDRWNGSRRRTRNPVCDPLNPNTTTSTTNEEEPVDRAGRSHDRHDHTNYSCYAEPRTIASGFRDEFQLTTIDPPYDLAYTEAYHRPLSGACAPGPGVMPSPDEPLHVPCWRGRVSAVPGNLVSRLNRDAVCLLAGGGRSPRRLERTAPLRVDDVRPATGSGDRIQSGRERGLRQRPTRHVELLLPGTRGELQRAPYHAWKRRGLRRDRRAMLRPADHEVARRPSRTEVGAHCARHLRGRGVSSRSDPAPTTAFSAISGFRRSCWRHALLIRRLRSPARVERRARLPTLRSDPRSARVPRRPSPGRASGVRSLLPTRVATLTSCS